MQRSERGRRLWQRRYVVVLLSLLAVALLALPAVSSADGVLPGSTVLVCQVTGAAAAPHYASVNVAVEQVAAYLNEYPGSFVGACPAPPASSGSAGSGTPNAAVLVCQVTGNVSSPFTQVSVAADKLAGYLNQNQGAFAGACPAPATAGGPAGAGGSGSTGVPGAAIAVCKVSGNASALSLLQVSLTVDQVAAFLARNPGSFVGACSSSGSAPGGGVSRSGLNGGLTVCHVSGSAATSFAQVTVAVDDLATYLNRHPGSFVGTCPSSGDANGTPGPLPEGFVTICRVTGNASSPYATQTVAVRELAVFLTQAGTIAPAPSAGCPTAATSGSGSGTGTAPASSTSVGTTRTIVVHTSPNTVVTASGAGVKQASKSNKNGQAVLKVKPKHPGIVTVKARGGKIVRRFGVAGKQTSGKNLTG